MTNFQRGYGEILPDWVPPDEEYITEKEAKRKAGWARIQGAWIGAAAMAAGIFAAEMVNGQVPQTRMHLEGPAGECFAVVVIYNTSGRYNADEALETAHGTVVLRYHTVGQHNATDDDEVSVVSLPDGVIAAPDFLRLPDGETGRICLIEWVAS